MDIGRCVRVGGGAGGLSISFVLLLGIHRGSTIGKCTGNSIAVAIQ